MSPFAVFVVFLLGPSLADCANFTTVLEWGFKEMDYAWPTEANRTKALQDGAFHPEQMHPTFMAVYKDTLFLSFYKYFGVPVTLVSLPTSSASSAPPKLAPFPNWQFHERQEGCNYIKEARGLDVDSEGRLWVVDEHGSNECGAKLWIFELAEGNKVRLVHRFPAAVAGGPGRNLRDLLLEQTPEDTLAFVADANEQHVIVFSLRKNESWTVGTPGKRIVCLALSPGADARLFFSRRDSEQLYSLALTELRAESANAQPHLIGAWRETPYAILIDAENVMYAAFFGKDYISAWNVSEPFREQPFYEPGRLRSYGPFIFGTDERGTLWLVERNQTWNSPKHKLLKAARLDM